MPNKEFLKLCFVLLYKDKTGYIFSAFLFVFIVFVLSSVLFVSNSIKYDMSQTINQQPQIVIKNQKAGKDIEITDEHIDTLLLIDGVSDVVGKIDGYYYFSQDDRYFHIIGDDDQDYDSMLIGDGIAKILDKFYYKEYFNFIIDGDMQKVNIQNTITKKANIISNDIMILNTQKAIEVLKLGEQEYSYIVVHIPNDSEIDFISQKIKETYPHMKIKTKEQLQAELDHLFYYKGGVFLILYIVVLLSFFVLLKNQVASTIGNSKKIIAVLRSIGFSITHVISLKFIQNSIVSIYSYIAGILIAYVYVFVFGAPLLKNIFLGSGLSNDIVFTPIFDFHILFLIFLFTVVPFLSAVILPSWKIAISDMSEAMK